jgi:adenylate cyclase
MLYRFDDCEIDTARFELRRHGKPHKVEPQVFELLRFLVERQGQFVDKETLHRAIWQGRIVSDATIASCIKAARRAIGDDGSMQRLIRTVHGRGFCFVALVDAVQPSELPLQDAAPGDTTDPAATPARNEVVLSVDVHLGALLAGDVRAETSEENVRSWRLALRTRIEESGGRVLAMTGGGISAHFAQAADAIACAGDLASWSSTSGLNASADEPPLLRIGLCNMTEDIEDATAKAGRIQCLAAPGDVCITRSILERTRDTCGIVSKPVAADLPNELRELDLQIIHKLEPIGVLDVSGIAQLRCRFPPPPREPSIVLLPFQAIGSDERASELAEGLRIDIQNALAKISRLLLIAAGSANALRGKSPEVAARSLGVRYVLHGTVQIVKRRARISLELIDTFSTISVWTEQFEIGLSDPFALQDEVTRKVITALDVKLYSGEQARIWHQALTDPKIVRIFYRGVRLFFRMDRDAMGEARRSFESVANLRPESSIGPTWTALCHWIDFTRRWSAPQADARTLARKWAEAAALLPDADGQAHTVLAHVKLLDREFEEALSAGREAIEIRPGCANANGFFGNVLHYCGEQHEAVKYIRKGIRLQPVYPPWFASVLATSYFAAGQTECALVVAKEALRLNPRDLQAQLVLVAAHHAAGNHRLGRVFAQELVHWEKDFSVAAYCERQPYRHRESMKAMASAWLQSGLPA